MENREPEYGEGRKPKIEGKSTPVAKGWGKKNMK